MSERSKKYFESFNAFLVLERKHELYPPMTQHTRRCEQRDSFIDPNALTKACKETIYFIGVRQISETDREYIICSSKGDIYFVTIGTLNYCTCFRYANNTIQCKHILYILIKVMKVSTNSTLLFQNGFTMNELDQMFAKSPVLIDSLTTNQSILTKWNKISKSKGNKLFVKRKAIQEDYCPKCLEILSENDKGITWCRRKCGRNIHNECFDPTKSKCMHCDAQWMYAKNVKYINVFKPFK
eukprot:UN05733